MLLSLANTVITQYQAADAGVMKSEIYEFAKQQMSAVLGLSTGMSYVVGIGANYPLRPSHKSSSCPDK